MEVCDRGSGLQREGAEGCSHCCWTEEELEAQGGVVTRMRSQDKLGAGHCSLGFSWLGLWPAGRGGGVAGASRPPQRTSSGSPAVREHMGPYGHIRGTPAADGEVAAAILAFWIYMGTASHWSQGGRGPEWSLGVQVGLDMELGSWQMV